MSEVRKVTAFITRGRGATAELLVFHHAASGVQLPAGTVEPGESFEQAVLRETAEETGLAGPFRLTRLGSEAVDLPEQHAVLAETASLRFQPAASSDVLGWSLRHAWTVTVIAAEGDYSRVRYEVRDLEDAGPDAMVFVRIEGWLESCLLTRRVVREFFHLECDGILPDRWQVQAEARHSLYWLPLSPPPGLIDSNRRWLELNYDALLGRVGAGKA